jgi:hypothetical protein
MSKVYFQNFLNIRDQNIYFPGLVFVLVTVQVNFIKLKAQISINSDNYYF